MNALDYITSTCDFVNKFLVLDNFILLFHPDDIEGVYIIPKELWVQDSLKVGGGELSPFYQ